MGVFLCTSGEIRGVLQYQWIISTPGKGDEVKKIASLFGPYWSSAFDNFKEKAEWINQHVRVNSRIVNEIEELATQYDVENCIGLYLRGTDYISLRPSGHYVQPALEEIIPAIDQFIEKYDAPILLVTEDNSFIDGLIYRYGNRIRVAIPENVIKSYKSGAVLSKSIAKQNAIRNGQQYLEKILLLSRCRYLIAGKTNGSLMSLIWNGDRYEDCFLFDKGLYP